MHTFLFEFYAILFLEDKGEEMENFERLIRNINKVDKASTPQNLNKISDKNIFATRKRKHGKCHCGGELKEKVVIVHNSNYGPPPIGPGETNFRLKKNKGFVCENCQLNYDSK